MDESVQREIYFKWILSRCLVWFVFVGCHTTSQYSRDKLGTVTFWQQEDVLDD